MHTMEMVATKKKTTHKHLLVPLTYSVVASFGNHTDEWYGEMGGSSLGPPVHRRIHQVMDVNRERKLKLVLFHIILRGVETSL